MLSPTFLRRHARELTFGFAMCLGSSVGQTFFISLFGGQIRADFGVSDGLFGTIYSVATLASAFTLIWVGRLVDHLRLGTMATLVLVGLATASLVMSRAPWIAGLAISIYGLRLFGQGLASHTGITAMARRFSAERGRAVSIATLGHTAGEAVLPAITVAALAALAWRSIWTAVAIALVLAIPVLRWLARPPVTDAPATAPLRPPDQVRREAVVATAMATADADHVSGDEREPPPRVIATGRDHRVYEVLREPSFWLRVPAVIAPGFIFTGLILHQVALAESKGWSLTSWAQSYVVFAVLSVVAVVVTGPAVDRISASRLVPFFLAPLILSCVVLWSGDAPIVAPLFMGLMALSNGATSVISGGLWPELFGIRHLGAIRSLVQATMVFGTGVAPAIVGVLLDRGASLESIAFGAAVYGIAASILAALAPAPRRSRPSGPSSG